MARYDWFIRSCNKISSPNPYLIGREVYIVTDDYKLVEGIVMDARTNILSYKTLDEERKPHYFNVLMKRKNKEWFLSKERAQRKIDLNKSFAQINAEIEAEIAAGKNIEDWESSGTKIKSEDY